MQRDRRGRLPRNFDSFQMDKTNILGIAVNVIDRSQLFRTIDALAPRSSVSLVNNVNAHACNLACCDAPFRQILRESEVVFCDGFGVKLAALLLGKKMGERMTPPDWIDDLFRLCVSRCYRIYFLGDTAPVVQQFAERVAQNHPLLNIVGFQDGFFDLSGGKGRAITRELVRLKPHVILTAMGMPRQEKWAWQMRSHLNGGVIISTGALFRWYAGVERRAPRWATQLGLEWLARLIAHPHRHFRRYMIGLPLFFMRIAQQRFNPRKFEW